MSARYAARRLTGLLALVLAHAATEHTGAATTATPVGGAAPATARKAGTALPSPRAAGTDAATSRAVAAAPGNPDAGIVLEPAVLALGATAVAVVVVSTPPGYTLRLVDSLPELAGVWTLDSTLLPVERGSARWIHRLRIRVRAREVGAFDWPALRLAIEGPDGAREPIDVAGRRVEIASSLAQRAPSDGPFGLRAPALPGSATDPLLSALVGSLATLSLLGLLALVRRERRRRRRDPQPAAALQAARSPAQPAARALLQTAQEYAAEDPVAAAALVTRAARGLLAELAHEAPAALATEELAHAPAPFALRSRWPRWLALLTELDRLRFVRAPEHALSRLHAALLAANALVDDTEPARPRESAIGASAKPSTANTRSALAPSDPPQAERVPGASRGPQGAQRPRTTAEAPSDPPQAERVPGASRGPQGAQRDDRGGGSAPHDPDAS